MICINNNGRIKFATDAREQLIMNQVFIMCCLTFDVNFEASEIKPIATITSGEHHGNDDRYKYQK